MVRSRPVAYDPHLYARTHRGTPGDLEFYRRLATGRVLELGAGFGRVTVAIADVAAVTSVVGLDIDAGLLSRAPTHERVEYREGDARDFVFEERFDRIFAPHGVLWCLLDDDEVHRCLSAVARHLAPDGRFAFDVWAADEMHALADPDDADPDHLDHVATLDDESPALDVLERSTWDKDTQRLDVTYLYVDEDEAVVGEGTIRQRYLLLDQIRAHLERAGLEAVSIDGDFAGTPYDGSHDHLIVVAKLIR